LVTSSYPPRPYLERDVAKLRALMERFRFATVITATERDEPRATQVPLVLDADRGGQGVLFGHFDRANPQAHVLDGRPVLVLFNGPNAYMSPRVYANGPLPTWNSMTVHVRGRIQALTDRARVVEGLCEIGRRSEPDSRLTPADPRIPELIEGIVGFEIEIDDLVGRFKLSQEHDESGRLSAARELATCTGQETFDLVGYLLGLPLDGGGACPFSPSTSDPLPVPEPVPTRRRP
jgi:predicted FMN-binding regulatory protein PaiB